MREIRISPPTRFLLRGSVCAIVLLGIWWLLLSGPLLVLLRSAVRFGAELIPGLPSLTVTENANGSWTFKVPLEATLPPRDANSRPLQIHSIDFDLAQSDAKSFTFGLPVFWAIMLAAPALRRNLRSLLLGTAVTALLEVALLFVTVQALAHRSAAQLLDTHDPFSTWFWKYSDYLTVNALPYVLPFVVAVLMHRALRQEIFQRAFGQPSQVADEVQGGGGHRKPKAARPSRGRSLRA